MSSEEGMALGSMGAHPIVEFLRRSQSRKGSLLSTSKVCLKS